MLLNLTKPGLQTSPISVGLASNFNLRILDSLLEYSGPSGLGNMLIDLRRQETVSNELMTVL